MYSPEAELYDVAVVGAGFVGVGLALELAAQGHKTLLVENRPSVGWEATWAYNLELARGVSRHADALAGRLAAADAMKGARIDQVAAEIALLQMLDGVRILHYCHVAGLAVEGGKAVSLQLAGKSGLCSVRAKAYVDATESGQLLGSPHVPDGHVFSFYLNKVEGALPASLPYGKSKLLLKPSVWAGELAVEFEAEELYSGRQEMPEILSFLRREVPALRQAFLTHSAIVELPLFRQGKAGALTTGLDNLFDLSGPGAPVALEGRGALLAARMRRGEDAATRLSAALKSLPAPAAAAPGMPLVKDSPVQADVLVCGGGTAGALAALAAARRGCKTTLLESSTSLGGIGTAGAIHAYYHGVVGGLQDEIDQRTDELGAAFAVGHKFQGFHPEAKKIVLRRLLDAAGASVLFETTVTGVETAPEASALPVPSGARAPRRIDSVVVNGSAGSLRLRAGNYIDSTGDADLAAKAGCGFTFGRDTDSVPHSYSQPAGRFHDESLLGHCNFDAGYCDPSDPWDMSRARIAGLKQYSRSSYVDVDRLLFLAPLLGLRNSRLIQGKYRLSFHDQLRCAEFDDVVGYTYSHYDNHAFDYENESFEAMLWVWALDNWSALIGSEIPFRCLEPEGIPNLLVACRAISMDHDAHNQLRMMRDMQRLGEVAGIAVALAKDAGVPAQDIDVKALQAELFKVGALKDQAHGYHCQDWKPQGLFALPDQKLLASRGLAGLLGGSELGDSKGYGQLLELVKRRADASRPEGRKAVPSWMPAIAIMGMDKVKEAVPALEKLLFDPASDQATLILAARALGRIGEPSSVDALEKLLARPDLPSEQVFQVSGGGKEPIKESSLWKLELAVAEALTALGRPRPDIVAKYLDDERAVVRRCAARLQA